MYPKKTIYSKSDRGDGITEEISTNIPDFDKFTEEDYLKYNLEKSEKENLKLKTILQWLAFIGFFVAAWYFLR